MTSRTFFAVLLLTALSSAHVALAAPVRVFAIGNEVRVEDVVTVQAFRNKMFALVDATLPNRASFVQPGVDDVVSHIQPADPEYQVQPPRPTCAALL